MIEYEIGGERFRSGKIDTFTQAFIAKRLLVIAAAIGPHAIRSGVGAAQRIAATQAVTAKPAANGAGNGGVNGTPVGVPYAADETAAVASAAVAPDDDGFDPMMLLMPLADALANMPDHDIRYVFTECMKVTQRYNAGGWQPIWNRAANDLQFEDIGLMEMIWITFQAMGDNIASFTKGPLASFLGSSPAGPQAPPSSAWPMKPTG